MSGHLNAFSGKHVDIRAVDQVVLKSQIIPSSAAVLKLEGVGKKMEGELEPGKARAKNKMWGLGWTYSSAIKCSTCGGAAPTIVPRRHSGKTIFKL